MNPSPKDVTRERKSHGERWPRILWEVKVLDETSLRLQRNKSDQITVSFLWVSSASLGSLWSLTPTSSSNRFTEMKRQTVGSMRTLQWILKIPSDTDWHPGLPFRVRHQEWRIHKTCFRFVWDLGRRRKSWGGPSKRNTQHAFKTRNLPCCIYSLENDFS